MSVKIRLLAPNWLRSPATITDVSTTMRGAAIEIDIV
jgi:hypothetical protein